ncbi:hypothetical protein L596_011035 [Steinernema carpocapsae]|uniref:Uncharacterized protein n=1 Tax=Steinernema carpocapsae TaxID=34508 RepID=A0A4U5NT37_STECR|nr:hypothetical protein L596_011035 [Steinernema carpocapsae]
MCYFYCYLFTVFQKNGVARKPFRDRRRPQTRNVDFGDRKVAEIPVGLSPTHCPTLPRDWRDQGPSKKRKTAHCKNSNAEKEGETD